MEERFIVTCRSTSGWLLLLLIFTNGYLAQKNTTPKTNSGWTFSKEESFVAFSPNLTLEQDQEIMFSFRTRSPNGLLFCHLVEHFNQSVHPLLRNYHFCAELSHGYLLVKYSLNQISDVMNLGRALNDDSWHSVDIFLETTSGKLVVSLDDLPSTSIYLRAYTQFTDVKAILDWTRLRSVVSFAGLTHAVAVEHHQFIGCLRSLKYRELIEVTWEVSPTIVMQATPGCQDLCQGENPCGEGRCINLYTSVHCDCSSLDREGDKCQNSNITALTLHGYEWLTYQLYSEEEKTLRDKNRFSLQFKSDRGSGVLLYAVGSIDAGGSLEQHHSHVIASVHQGTVKASVAFGDDILEQTMGIGVDDSRWHNLTIVHEKVKVEFYLDGVGYVHETVNDMYYLGLDPIIYIGGGKNFVQTLGLQVRQNFVGCLKNVYVNEHSVLYELRNNHSASQLHGNTNIQYGCHRVTNISLTFPKSKSILYLSGYYDSTFSIQFDFRTVRETAILLSAKIQTVDSFGYPVKGFFEVWINNTLPMMKFVRSMYYDSIANTTLLHVSVSDNQWHTLSFQLKDGQVKISVDNLSVPSLSIGNGSTIDKTIEIGYGYSRIYADHVGFVGCIRNLVIQKQFLDPINLMERAPSGGFQSGLILDGCKLVNHCLVHQHCQHGGRCLSDWDGVSCDCSSSAYQGKYCQFSRYQKSCDSYYQSGWRRSGVYVIDVDGSGPVEPTYVSCQMGIRTEGDYYGQTVVEHNLRNLTKVRGTTLPDVRLRLTYRGMGFVQLQQLTKISTWCEQYVQYRCLNAPIGLGNLTNFKSIDGGVVQYIGETDAVFTPGCSKGSCSCDNGNLVPQEDSGFNRVKSQLPIGEVTVYQYIDYTTPDSRGTLTIGPLKCWGNTESITSSSVTFVTENSFLKLPGWVYGDLEFSFRTHQRAALLLYQSSSNGDWFKVTLEAEDSIKMEMQIKGKMILRESLDADKPVNDGDWHRVTLELSSHEVRCGLDSQRRIIAIPFHNNITFDGLLYLGGKLYDHGSYNNLPGLSGCVKGLVYNGKLRNLTYDVYDDMPNILSGCRPHCSPDPCQNGAQCVEMWNDYRCICTNEWAHSGQSCETNINKNAVTVTGDSTAFFDLRVSSNPLEMEEKIVFSFRTQMYRALIFYMYDELNNFIQLEVIEGKKLRFTRNNFQQIFYKDIEVPGITQPTWKQVVLDPTKIIVDGKVTFLGLSNNKMESGYSTDPFANEEETVKPLRPAEKLPPFLRLYLGGTPENVTALEKYVGCIRGFKIGDHLIDLQKNSQNIAGINTGCKNGCNVNQCLNGGLCLERWGEGHYECDCSHSNFAGKQCELEASGIFTGQSVVHYKFVPYGEAAKTNTEQFSFIFKTNCSEKTMVLLLIFSETKGDYIMISLSTSFVRALWKQGNNLFEEKLKGYFCDGTAHKFMYKREGEEMWIKIDQSDWRKKFTTRTYLENMNMVLVGGLIPELTINMEQKYGDSNQTVNFTGCISEVTYTPVMRESNIVVQPMKELRDLKNGSIIVRGPEVPQCSPVDYHDPSQTTVPTTPIPTTSGHPTLGVTMPPWSIGGPEVYVIGNGNNITTPGPTTTTTPTTTTSTTTELVTTSMFYPTTEQGPTNVTLVLGQIITDTVPYITIFIVSSVLTLMCLVSVLIAVVMRRLRKRYVTYDVRKKYLDDFEMKEPLNHSMETYSPAPPPPKKDIHIATWDEFSMVSATLGPNKKKQNGIAPGKVHTLPADLRNTDYPVQTTFLPEDGVKYPVYNRKKNRPASSISEVLEEMERQQKAKELGVDPEQYEDPKSHGEGELEWDPLVDRTPLTLGIHHDTIYETQDEDSDGRSRATSSESEDPLKVLDQQEDLLQEYNGDSGYEAESQRNGDDDLDLGESLTPPTPDSSKLYYDITGVTESPKCPPRSFKLIIESEEQFV